MRYSLLAFLLILMTVAAASAQSIQGTVRDQS